MKNLIAQLEVAEVKTAQRALIDIDTHEDLAKAREVL
jgi:CTP:molybdopterin cytidylyltransferase MocA